MILLACWQVHAIKPNPAKTFFAPARPVRLPQLSWDPLEQPPGFARRYLQLEVQQGKPTDNAGRVRTMQSAEADAKARDECPAEQPRKKHKVQSATVPCIQGALLEVSGAALLRTLALDLHLPARYENVAQLAIST